MLYPARDILNNSHWGTSHLVIGVLRSLSLKSFRLTLVETIWSGHPDMPDHHKFSIPKWYIARMLPDR